MTIQNPAMALALFLVTTAALAAEPTSSTTAPPLQAPAAPLGVQVPASPTAKQAPAAAAAPASADATAKAAHALGYTPRQRSGKTVYCKAEAEIGSHLSSTKCYTPDEMTAVVKRSIDNQDSVAKMQRTELYEENKH